MTEPAAYDSADRVATYDADMDVMHPNRPRMVRAALDALPFDRDAPIAALDLGVGTGFFAQHFLQTFPRATLIGIDVAPAMLASARQRLGDLVSRADLRVADVRELRSVVSVWERGLVVLTSYTLHHLTHDEKVETLRSAYQFLEGGGWLVNADLLVAESPEVETRVQQLRVEGIVQRAGWKDERFATAAVTRSFLDDVEARDQDRPSTLADDLSALRRAGFERADVLWLEHREAVTVGVRTA